MFETRIENVTILGGRGARRIERRALTSGWEIVAIALRLFVLLVSFALTVVAKISLHHNHNWLLPLAGALALLVIVIATCMPWWRWKVQRQARRDDNKSISD